jgi:hypothetical protein
MGVSELFDIEPSHTDVNEISRRRLDYGDGWAPVGYATIWLRAIPPRTGLGDKAEWVICGVRGEDLLVQYLGGCVAGREHGSRRLAAFLSGEEIQPEPYVWVHAGAFSVVSILAKVSQPLPERYWHPDWQEINALPPIASTSS